MAIYEEYIKHLQNFEQITHERKKILTRISKLRNRDVLTFASDLSNNMAPIMIEYTDLLPVQSQLENLSGKAIDIILETPGGIGEVVEDIIDLIRTKYDEVGIIIPGYAKSAGTIFAMAGDEILMRHGSALGPIDGQLQIADGKRFSADAFLEGLEKIKDDAEKKKLNPAYIPILRNISPGEIQNCENIQCFSKHLATQWLVKYMFKYSKSLPDGTVTTEESKSKKAEKIAEELCSQSRWLTHRRSIKIRDLEKLGLKITNYEMNAKLGDAINRYYILLRMSFESSSIYKIFETESSDIYRFMMVPARSTPQTPQSLVMNGSCPNCKYDLKIQTNLEKDVPQASDTVLYPIQTDTLECPKCRKSINVKSLRQQVEAETGKKVI